MTNLKIGSLNVWGLGDEVKRKSVYSWLRDKQMNIYFLQETRCIPDKEKIWENEWGYKSYFSSSNRAAQGVQTLFMNNFQFTVKNTKSDNQGRYLIIHAEVGADNFVLVNVYGPNSDDSIFFENLFLDLEEFSQYPIIMGGI